MADFLTAQAAGDELAAYVKKGNKPTLSWLIDLAKRTSSKPTGKVSADTIYLLYNGEDVGGHGLRLAVDKLAVEHSGKFAAVSRTHFADLMTQNLLFGECLDNAIKDIAFNGRPPAIFTPEDWATYDRHVEKIMHGRENGSRIDNKLINGGDGPLWDIGSVKFVNENTGKFEFLSSVKETAEDFERFKLSTMGQGELPAFLKKTDGSTLNSALPSVFLKEDTDTILRAHV